MTLQGAERNIFSVDLIRSWCAYSRDHDLHLGLSNEEAMNWARSAWQGSRLASAQALTLGSDLPDRLYAVTKLALDDQDANADLPEYWYEQARSACWPTDPLGEKTQILTSLAYATWRQLRRSGDFRRAQAWEKAVASLASSQPATSEFLALGAEGMSEQLMLRFLSDPAVLLTVLVKLRSSINNWPSIGLQSALSLERWLSDAKELPYSREERSYFQCDARLTVAICLKHAGRYREAHAWLELAHESCRAAKRPECLNATVQFVRWAIAYETRRFDEAAAGAGELATQFEQFGNPTYVARCRYLEGLALKEQGKDDEAIRAFELVALSDHTNVEQWMRGMAHLGLAEICARRSEFEGATSHLGEAWGLIRQRTSVHALAYFHSISAEVQRGHGDLRGAISAYRTAVATYEKAGMEGMAAYVRVILAETLLADGQETASASEIVVALPTIERLSLFQEGIAAVALLRESLRRPTADREAVRRLRIELQRMNEQTQS
jgi:tetratricopeptide (TPR) repeat protein